MLKTILNELERDKLLNEIKDINSDKVKQYICETYKESLNEMARINTKEFNGFFPFNKFDVRIWSNDHNPPHFHVIGEDWDIIVSIENGEILKIKKIGKDSKFYTYVESFAKDWLESPCAINPKLTNYESAMLQWETNNPNS